MEETREMYGKSFTISFITSVHRRRSHGGPVAAYSCSFRDERTKIGVLRKKEVFTRVAFSRVISMWIPLNAFSDDNSVILLEILLILSLIVRHSTTIYI